MSGPQHEIEVDAAPVTGRLREVGCPYPATDERAAVWLEGYGAGWNTGADQAHKVWDRAMAQAGA